MLDLMSFANILSQITGNKNSSGILDGPGITGTSPNMPNGPTGQQEPDVMQQVLKLFQPNEQQFNKLSDTVGQMPQRSQYKPGLMDKISAYAAGLGTGAGPAGHYGGVPVGFQGDIPGGIKLQKSMLDDKYNQALGDWQNKVEPLGKLAQIEGQRNTNDRLIGGQVLSNERNNRRMTETERKDRETATINQGKLDVSQQRAEIAQERADTYKELAKGGTIQTDKEGQSWMVYKDGTKKNIDLQKFTPAELQELKTEGRLQEINASTAGAIKTEGVRQGNRISLEGVKNQNRTDTNKPETAANKQTREFLRAQEALNTHPEWAPYITLQQGKTFKVATPEEVKSNIFGYGGKAGGDPKVVEAVNKFIYGEPSQSNEKGRVRISDGNGHFGTVTQEDSLKLPKPWYVVTGK